MIIGIVAIAKNYAIGKDGKLPWHYPSDLKFFKQTTVGNAVVMGSTTWRSIGKPLPNRLNIVLSRSNLDLPSGVLLFRDTQGILALADHLKGNVFVIGGAKVFESFADVIDEWIVTEVPDSIDDADVFMPKNFLDRFENYELTEIGPGLTAKRFRRKGL